MTLRITGRLKREPKQAQYIDLLTGRYMRFGWWIRYIEFCDQEYRREKLDLSQSTVYCSCGFNNGTEWLDRVRRRKLGRLIFECEGEFTDIWYFPDADRAWARLVCVYREFDGMPIDFSQMRSLDYRVDYATMLDLFQALIGPRTDA